MMKPSLPDHEVSVLFSAETIQARVAAIGAEICKDLPDHSEPLLLVGVLKGASLFLADLVRAIDRPLEFDFVAIASYGAETRSSGEVRLLKDLDIPVHGKHVIIVEDILDTGLSSKTHTFTLAACLAFRFSIR